MSIAARFFRWHRWLAWLVALQVLAWLAGGFVFTWLPFKPWVKAEDSVSRPVQPLPADWAGAVARHLAAQPTPQPVQAVASVATATGPALRLRHARGESWVAATGGPLAPPDEAAVARFARGLYKGTGALAEVRLLAEVPARLLIVREAGARRDVWRATFDDGLGTRLYIDSRSGELVAVRNDAWVLYDFFWRLHLMDYGEGEDFSHPLVKAASAAGLVLVLTGVVLAMLALRRTWRHWRRRRSLPADGHRAGHA
ncbi:MAG: PepSY domain-containing protein [Rubrivivax sp.]|nr:PepSY domain-containing protein [Rubrivivax sp.]